MSLSAELACAARALQVHGKDLPAPRVTALWNSLMNQVERCRSAGAAELLILEWRRDLPNATTNQTPPFPHSESVAASAMTEKEYQ